ncbi:MAG: hypothetical protein WDO70_07425 [Alphaproteobacteria bacterium]
MLRNILITIGVFAVITGLALYLIAASGKGVSEDKKTVRPEGLGDVRLTLEPDGDFLPRQTPPAITVRAQGAKTAYLRFYHIQDSALLLRLYRGIDQGSLSQIAVARLLAENAVPFAMKPITLKDGETAPVAWPPSQGPGLYVATTAIDAMHDAMEATWFMHSDLHVLVINDSDSWHIKCESIATGQEAADVPLTLFGFTGELASASCGPNGMAVMAKKQLPDKDQPQLLLAQDSLGNMAFVPLRAASIRAENRNNDDFVASDRAHYQAGQKIHALAYGPHVAEGKAVLAVVRPDGLRIMETKLTPAAGKLVWQDWSLPPDAPPGKWRILLLVDGMIQHQAEIAVGEEDAGLITSAKVIERRDGAVTLAAKITDEDDNALKNQSGEVTMQWENARQFPDIAADYAFGGYDQPEPRPATLASFITGGGNHLSLQLPAPPDLPYPVQARLKIEPWPRRKVADAQTATVAWPTRPWALGIRALFGDAVVPGGSKANFAVALFKTGNAEAIPDSLGYELVTERRSFRWFFADGKWDYKSDVAAAPIISGNIKLDAGKGQISVPVQNGQYRLDVFTADRKLQSSWRFQAGADKKAVPTADLPLQIVRHADGGTKITARASGPITLIVADDRVRQILTDRNTEDREAVFDIDPAIKQGTNIVALAVHAAANNIKRGAAWLPPQSAIPMSVIKLPDVLRAGAPAKIAVQLPQATSQPSYAQILAVPVAGEASDKLLTAALGAAQARRIGIASNVTPEWPDNAVPVNPTTDEAINPADSSLSSIATLAADGSGEITLPLPRYDGKVQLHLLVWNQDGFREQTLAIRPSAALEQVPAAKPPAEAAWRWTASDSWRCQEFTAKSDLTFMPPHGGGGKNKRAQNPAESWIALAPVALPDFPASMARIFSAHSVQTDILARLLLAEDDYAAIMAAYGMPDAARLSWRERIWTTILSRQRGDGGIGQYPDAESAPGATAQMVLAWRRHPPGAAEDMFTAAVNFLKHRLNIAWNAENELPGRSRGFYALSVIDQIDPSGLRHFVDKFGNQIRDAANEAELAAALKKIGDQEQSQAFAARALAQMPSLRGDNPGRALQALEILARHELAPGEKLAAALRDVELPSPQTAVLAANALGARAAIAGMLGEWRANLNGQPITKRGIYAAAPEAKTVIHSQEKPERPLYLCHDYAARQKNAAPSPKPSLERNIWSAAGQKLSAAALNAGGSYVVTVAGKDFPAGRFDIDLPLPPELQFRAALPGGTIAGAYGWLERLDHTAAAQANSDGVSIAVDRTAPGDLRVAIIVEAVKPGASPWQPAYLAANGKEHASAPAKIAVRR